MTYMVAFVKITMLWGAMVSLLHNIVFPAMSIFIILYPSKVEEIVIMSRKPQ